LHCGLSLISKIRVMKTSMSIFKFKVVTRNEGGKILGSVPFATKRSAKEFAEKIVHLNNQVYSVEVVK